MYAYARTLLFARKHPHCPAAFNRPSEANVTSYEDLFLILIRAPAIYEYKGNVMFEGRLRVPLYFFAGRPLRFTGSSSFFSLTTLTVLVGVLPFSSLFSVILVGVLPFSSLASVGLAGV